MAFNLGLQTRVGKTDFRLAPFRRDIKTISVPVHSFLSFRKLRSLSNTRQTVFLPGINSMIVTVHILVTVCELGAVFAGVALDFSRPPSTNVVDRSELRRQTGRP
jgi:hypothetical protein